MKSAEIFLPRGHRVTCQAIALDDGGIGDDVGVNTRLTHIFQQHAGFLHAAAFRAGVQHGVVGDGVARDAVVSHFLRQC